MSNSVRAADFKHHRLKGHIDGVTGLAWDSSGSLLVSSSFDGTTRSWDPDTRTTLQTVKRDDQWMTGIALSADGRRAVITLRDCALVWDPYSGRELGKFTGHRRYLWDAAISSDGRYAATASHDQTVRVWELDTQREVTHLVGHTNTVLSVVLTDDGRQAITAGDDATIRIWSVEDGEATATLAGHSAPVRAVALTRDQSQIVSASMDATIKVWDLRTGQELVTLEGHGDAVGAIAISGDGRLLASASFDGSVILWRCDTWAPVSKLKSACTKFPVGLAFCPSTPILATIDRGQDILLWEIDTNALLGIRSTDSSSYYANAKVAILGESGTGKSCLVRALAGEPFAPQESTHGMRVWNLGIATVHRSARDITQETFLWDFAGQSDYHLVHQLFLARTSLAIVLFDGTHPENPFGGVEEWRNAFQRVAGERCPALLVAGRVDRGFPVVSKEEIEEYRRNHGFEAFMATSAKTMQGVQELRNIVDRYIPWNTLPVTSSPKLWQAIRDYLIVLRERTDVLLRASALRDAFRVAHTDSSFTDDEFSIVVSHAQAQGLVWKLSFGDLLLLRPELLNSYSSAVVQAARKHPLGLGSVVKRDVLEARVNLDGVDRLLSHDDERLLLHGVVELLLDSELAFREGELLVFPSKHNRGQQEITRSLLPQVRYRYSGLVESIYATLVVRLAYCGAFSLHHLCRNAAEFKDPLGHSCGVILESGRKGHADIIVSFEEAVSLDSRVLFLRFVDEHLRRKAKPDSLARSRVYRCPVCEEEITNDRAVATRLAKGLRDIPCQYCGEAVPLTDMLEQSFEEPRWFDQVRALDNAVAKERAKAVSEITVKAKKQVDDFDVFLAHNAQDKPQVEKIAQHLKERGLNPWLDKWNLPPGRRIAEEIERVLPNTRAVAVFIAAVGTGPWEQLEIYAALQLFVKNRRPLIPVLLPGATGTSGLPLFLQQFNIVRFDLDVHDENALDNLQWGITGQQPGRGEDGSGMVARRGFLSTTSSSFPTS